MNSTDLQHALNNAKDDVETSGSHISTKVAGTERINDKEYTVHVVLKTDWSEENE